jgi:hypothetical protein
MVQLLLGDGELCIQALLDGRLHSLVESSQVAVGSYVRADDYSLKSQRVEGDSEADGPHTMVFLVLEDIVPIGWNDSFRAQWLEQQVSGMVTSDKPEDDHQGQDTDLGTSSDVEAKKLHHVPNDVDKRSSPVKKSSPLRLQPPKSSYESYSDDAAIEDAFDAFDARTFPRKTVRFSSDREPSPTVTDSKSTKKAKPSKNQPIALPRDWHNPQTPLRLTTLHAVPRLPYTQNWSCNVLAIVASLGDVVPSNLLPHRQRTARLADPSTAKLVTLTVFLEPEQFVPRVGSAVLLLGVKNHRSDGGSLKKYASDAGKEGDACRGRWWMEDPWDLSWCDVGGIKQWWSEMERSRPPNG